jgi:hypothetical protein
MTREKERLEKPLLIDWLRGSLSGRDTPIGKIHLYGFVDWFIAMAWRTNCQWS